MNKVFAVATAGIYQAKKPIRSERYRRFIRGFGCIACEGTRRIESAHTGPHGLSQKASDMGCIPLCSACHMEFDADPRGFAAMYDLDIAGLIAVFNQLWGQRRTA